MEILKFGMLAQMENVLRPYNSCIVLYKFTILLLNIIVSLTMMIYIIYNTIL